MHSGGQFVLALVLVGVPALCLLGMARRHRARGSQGQPRAAGGGGIVSGWFAHRRALRLENTRNYNGMLREAVRHRYRLAEQRERDARRAAQAPRAGRGSTGTAAGEPGDPGSDPDGSGEAPSPHASAWQATVTHVWSRWHPAWDAVRRRMPGTPALPAAPAGPPPSSSAQDPPRSPEPPAPAGSQPPQQPPPASPAPGLTEAPTVEGVIVTTPATVEAVPGVTQVAEGLHAIFAHAMAGNIQAKRRGVLALIHVGRQSAAAALALARAMGEQRNYGIEITERVSAMAMYFTAAATAGTEADTGLVVLLHSSVAENMAAGRQMPHHEELQESGAR